MMEIENEAIKDMVVKKINSLRRCFQKEIKLKIQKNLSSINKLRYIYIYI